MRVSPSVAQACLLDSRQESMAWLRGLADRAYYNAWYSWNLGGLALDDFGRPQKGSLHESRNSLLRRTSPFSEVQDYMYMYIIGLGRADKFTGCIICLRLRRHPRPRSASYLSAGVTMTRGHSSRPTRTSTSTIHLPHFPTTSAPETPPPLASDEQQSRRRLSLQRAEPHLHSPNPSHVITSRAKTFGRHTAVNLDGEPGPTAPEGVVRAAKGKLMGAPRAAI
ncbi:hypothetical protein G7Y89_g5669 [Cudoniella acicularis]|uniref:Uncharacterized protein n=1 Tax=Cudoniella acicularis TaxID=354080 RepID=A0A8H4RM19_9HELO|nr:hypothetical protein G7Y89_g5669 [Cudoniella acicularis]